MMALPIAGVIVLSFSGRFKVIVATAPSCTKSNSSGNPGKVLIIVEISYEHLSMLVSLG